MCDKNDFFFGSNVFYSVGQVVMATITARCTIVWVISHITFQLDHSIPPPMAQDTRVQGSITLYIPEWQLCNRSLFIVYTAIQYKQREGRVTAAISLASVVMLDCKWWHIYLA